MFQHNDAIVTTQKRRKGNGKPFPVVARTYGHLRLQARLKMARITGSVIEPVEYFVSYSDRVVYIVNAKAGCSSIQAELLSRAGVTIDHSCQDKGDVIYRAAKKEGFYSRTAIKDKNWPYFTFVRNPFDRFASFYKNKVADRSNLGRHRYIHAFFKGANTFSEAAQIAAGIPDHLANRHYKSQSYLVLRESYRCDFVGRIETMPVDLSRLSDFVDLTNIQTLNSTPKTEPLSQYYDRQSFDLIYGRYASDITEFGY